ncbi:MAG TPA: spore protease YyaC [Candidatus Lachnoclostridium stercoravium]|uniref:Spore protease YyaC n=1 Tax=Candidatus Lachnoclostridium stercoravium TaxID=2838633 RepID=A0A9D2HEM5_9FIRM|nr:spore protease YyaC [Candidatus Lachnoclostridium stercoravium]
MKLWERIKIRGNREVYYYDAKNGWEIENFAFRLYGLIKDEMEAENKKGVVFLCIGTDRSTGDSLGPLIGYKLKGKRIKRAEVIGTLEKPVHAMNLEQYLKAVRLGFPDHLIVAVDASVGNIEHIGYITLGKGPLKPGLGVSKELMAVGDIFITGIVGSCKSSDPIMLQSIRLSVVMRLADCISESIYFVEKLWDRAASV